MPWVMIVDSSATIGFLAERASATSGEKSRSSAALIAFSPSSGRNRPPRFIGNLPFRINAADGARDRPEKGCARGRLAVRRIPATLRAPHERQNTRSMDDKPQNVPVQPDLAGSIRQARVENAERADAIAEMRELEIVRLKALESALEAVIDQAPQGVDLFDMALTQSEHPRLFLDML